MSQLANSHVVITGGKGFVGYHLVNELTAVWAETQITVWDLPTVDILKPETYAEELKRLQPAWVVHLAALAAVGTSLKEPARVQEVNVTGTQRLLETVTQVSPSTQILAISSSDIYGLAASERHGVPIPELELAACHPRNPYAESKLAMEQLIVDRFLDRCIRVRPFAHIGPYQKQGFVTADFASQIAAIELGKQAPVIRVGNLEAKRDFTDVRDVVRAYRLLMEQGQIGDVYNVASGRAVSIAWVLEKLQRLSSVKISVEQDPTRMRPSDIPLLIGDAQKLRTTTGWQPAISLEQSLQDVLNYWREIQT